MFDFKQLLVDSGIIVHCRTTLKFGDFWDWNVRLILHCVMYILSPHLYIALSNPSRSIEGFPAPNTDGKSFTSANIPFYLINQSLCIHLRCKSNNISSHIFTVSGIGQCPIKSCNVIVQKIGICQIWPSWVWQKSECGKSHFPWLLVDCPTQLICTWFSFVPPSPMNIAERHYRPPVVNSHRKVWVWQNSVCVKSYFPWLILYNRCCFLTQGQEIMSFVIESSLLQNCRRVWPNVKFSLW